MGCQRQNGALWGKSYERFCFVWYWTYTNPVRTDSCKILSRPAHCGVWWRLASWGQWRVPWFCRFYVTRGLQWSLLLSGRALPWSTWVIPFPVITFKLQEVERKPWADIVSLKAVIHVTVRLEIVCSSCTLRAPQYEGKDEPHNRRAGCRERLWMERCHLHTE